MTERTFDYQPRYDPRSLNYRVQSGPMPAPKTWRYWRQAPVLDQGTEGACVGHGVVGAIASAPYRTAFNDIQSAAFGYYELAQHLDHWEGEDYSGTSVLAGAKVAQRTGMIKEYHWCTSISEVVWTVLNLGPVVIGVPWTDKMNQPDRAGMVDTSGEVIGGHCVYLTGFSYNRKLFGHSRGPIFRFRNSWGKDWGRRGNGYFRQQDLQELLKNGEACYFSK